ncbi:MAG: low molecular weight protein arginine phosphatase [Bacillota bacterium]|jgi:protein-tyrosine-phosphatase
MMKILFVCTGNTCRSPMAEAIFPLLYESQEKTPQVFSAGLHALTLDKATDNAVLTVEKRGGNLRDFRSKLLSTYLLDEADLVVTMTQAHKNMLLSMDPRSADKVISMAEIGGCDIPDPYGGDLAEYEACLQKIETGLKKLQSKLEKSVDKNNLMKGNIT